MSSSKTDQPKRADEATINTAESGNIHVEPGKPRVISAEGVSSNIRSLNYISSSPLNYVLPFYLCSTYDPFIISEILLPFETND
jgi:hypothetical protein